MRIATASVRAGFAMTGYKKCGAATLPAHCAPAMTAMTFIEITEGRWFRRNGNGKEGGAEHEGADRGGGVEAVL